MKLLIVTSNYPRWKGDTTTPFVHNFAVELINQGYQVKVLAPHFKGAEVSELMDGVEVKRFRYALPLSAQTVCYQGGALGNLNKRPLEKLKLPILVGCELLALIKEIVIWKPDVVNSHWLLPQGFVAALACKLTRTRHVATVHGGDVFALSSPLFNKLKKFAIDNSELVTVNSSVTEKVAKALSPTTNTPFLRLPTGILPLPKISAEKVKELRNSLQQEQDEKLILFVGRLSEEKGVREAIEATHILLQEDLKVRLIIIGEGHEKSVFQSLVNELSLSGHVDFIGWVENKDVYTYFKACDVFVGPSKQSKDGWIEAQGLTFVEAMLAGCPVIGSRSGGIVDAVIPGETGWLVNPSDSVDLKKAIDESLYDLSMAIDTEKASLRAKDTYEIANVVARFSLALRSNHD